MRGLRKWLLYGAAGIFFYLFFVMWTFPFDLLKGKILSEAEKGMGGAYQIKADHMSLGYSAVFTGLELIDRKSGQEVSLLKLPSMKLHHLPSTLLSSTKKLVDVEFSAKTAQGTLEGTYYDSPEINRVELKLEDLGLKDFNFLDVSLKSDVSGEISGDYLLELDKKTLIKSTGKINLDLINLKLGEIFLKPKGQTADSRIHIPSIQLTGAKNSRFVATLSGKGEMDINEFVLKGGDLELTLTGKIIIGPKFDDYRIVSEGKLKILPSLMQSDPTLSTYLSMLETQKSPDGNFDVRIEGKLIDPSFTIGSIQLDKLIGLDKN